MPAPACRSTCSTTCRSWRSRPPASASSFSPASARPRPRRRRWPAPGNAERAGNIGLPLPGVELKLVPRDGKFEARLKGANITPGYWRAPALTADAFDDEGFYKIGDALKFDDPGRSGQGIAVRRPARRGFQARDRHLGQRRAAARGIHRALCAPLVRDVVLAGAGPRRGDGAGVSRSRRLPQARAGALPPRLRRTSCSPSGAVRCRVRRRLVAFAAAARGTSSRITRAMLLAEPPSLDIGEMTDKGSINQRAVLAHRAAWSKSFTPSRRRPMSSSPRGANGTR